MCFLVLNTAVSPSYWLLFSDNWEFLGSSRFDIAGREFDELLPTLHAFLSENSVTIESLKKVYGVAGPISFTGGRIVTLTLTTLSRVYPIELYSLTVFEFWEFLGNSYPMAIEANTTELVECRMQGGELSLVQKGGEYATWEASRFGLPNQENRIQWKSHIEGLRSGLSQLSPIKQIEPLYLKKPNITLSSLTHG